MQTFLSNVSTVHQQIQQNKTGRSKSQQEYLDSKCSLRTCVLRLRTNHFGLFRLQGRWVKVGLCLFFQVRPSLQLEQATHTALKAWKHWQMFQMTSKEYSSKRHAIFMWVSLFVLHPLYVFGAFHIITEFKKSNVAKAKPLIGIKVTSFPKRFTYPQNWNRMFAHLVDGSRFHAIVQSHITHKAFRVSTRLELGVCTFG